MHQETHKIHAISLFYELQTLRDTLEEKKKIVECERQVSINECEINCKFSIIQKTLTLKSEVSNLRKEISRLKVLTTSISLGKAIQQIDEKQRNMSVELMDLFGSDSSFDGDASVSLSHLPYIPDSFEGGIKAAQVMQMLAD